MSQNDARQLLPNLARAFADLGYRRATTATLAKACGVRENVMYRVWPSKKEMFLAAIDYVWQSSSAVWRHLLQQSPPGDAAGAVRRLLQYESTRHGEMGLYRVVFAGLTESDDPDIAVAMRRMYENFHGFIADQVSAARGKPPRGGKMKSQQDDLIAWALVGLATVANIGHSLGLPSERQRSLLYTRIGKALIEMENESS